MLNRVGQYIKNNFFEEAQRWVLWLPVFYGTGIGIYFGLYNEPPVYLVCLVVGVSWLALLVLWKNFATRLLAIILVTMSLGFAVAKINTEIVRAPIVPVIDHPMVISGNITNISSEKGFPQLFLHNLRIDELGADVPKNVKISVRSKIKEPVEPGDRIITNAVLIPPYRPAFPGGYDQARTLYYDGLGASGYAVKAVAKLPEGAEDNYLQRVRYHISNKLLAALPGDEGALVDALATGNRSHLSDGAHDALRNSGLAHLLAIAGMHQALAGGFIFLLARFILALFPRFSEVHSTKKIAAVFAIICNFVYLLLSGMPYSAIRAFIMFFFFMLGVVFDRASLSVKSLGFAAIVILTFAPEAILGPSFQMSFAAVLSLISVYEILSKRRLARQMEEEVGDDYSHRKWQNHLGLKIRHHAVGIALTSLIAGMATAPYSMFHFNQFVNYGVLANLLVMPITGLIVMPSIVLGMFMMPLGLEKFFLQPAGWGIGLILKIGAFVSGLPYATSHIPQMPVWGLVITTLGGLWVLLWQRRWRWWGLIFVVIGCLSPLTVTMPDIIINENAKFFAINYDGKLYFSKTRKNFAVKNWMQNFVQSDKLMLEEKDSYEVKGYVLSTDATCVYKISGAHETLCLSETDLEKNGTHNIYLRDDKIVVETVEGRRGKRLWSQNSE